MNKIREWFFSTKLGELYFNIVLYIDRKFNKPKYTGKQLSQVIREYSLINEGIISVKKRVKTLVDNSSSKDIKNVLHNTDDLVKFAERDNDRTRSDFIKTIRQSYVKRGDRDINNSIEHAKMIDGRIQDYKQLQEYNYKRNLQRRIREASKIGNLSEVTKLKEEWNSKYGSRRN